MATAQSEIITEPKLHDPRLHLWTSEEYYKLADAGLFEGKRVELISGRIIEMSAMSRPHVKAVKRAVRVFEAAFGKGWFVQNQAPLDLDDIDAASQPEPDVAVIEGDEDDYEDEHPTTAALVLEVSFASLKYDRDKKASLYAKSGIADYWILNLRERQLEVFRRPVPDASSPFWYSYADLLIFKEDESVSPLAKPEAVITVKSLLPPKSRKALI
jgi:Uma2 family endonuclease